MKSYRRFISLFLITIVVFGLSGALWSCGDNDAKDPEKALEVSTKNLQGMWTFIRSESNIGGHKTSMEATDFNIDELPLGEAGLYYYNLSFTGNSLNGFPYELYGSQIYWSLMSAEVRNNVTVVIVTLTSTYMVIHYEYHNAGNDHISGYTDIRYNKVDQI